MIKKITAANAAANEGAITIHIFSDFILGFFFCLFVFGKFFSLPFYLPISIPAKIAARPFPLFQPQFTAFLPPSATPTPARAETILYVVETGHDLLVAIINQILDAVSAHTNARSSIPAFF